MKQSTEPTTVSGAIPTTHPSAAMNPYFAFCREFEDFDPELDNILNPAWKGQVQRPPVQLLIHLLGVTRSDLDRIALPLVRQVPFQKLSQDFSIRERRNRRMPLVCEGEKRNPTTRDALTSQLVESHLLVNAVWHQDHDQNPNVGIIG